MAKWNKGNPAPNVKDIIGQKFGRLTVIARHPVNSNDRKARWICKCDCGNEIVVTGKALRKGTTQSCGCLRRETTAKKNYKHGGSFRGNAERLYGIYQDMRRRCYDPRRPAYPDYGGRGIYICNEWYYPDDFAKGYVAFRDWAYKNGYYDQPDDTPYGKMLSIDRIDNDGPYAPWNCRWVDMYHQSNNRGDYNQEIYDGEEMLHFGQFERKYNLQHPFIFDKLNRGWSFSRIVYKAQHPDYKVTIRNSLATDPDGFMHLIPKLDQRKARNHYGRDS